MSNPNPPGVFPATLELIVSAVKKLGGNPTVNEVATEVEMHSKTVVRAWRTAFEHGRLPSPPKPVGTGERRRRTQYRSSGHCTPETADKIIRLLHCDPGARMAFDSLVYGGKR